MFSRSIIISLLEKLPEKIIFPTFGCFVCVCVCVCVMLEMESKAFSM
jgi:hypothetical protein